MSKNNILNNIIQKTAKKHDPEVILQKKINEARVAGVALTSRCIEKLLEVNYKASPKRIIAAMKYAIPGFEWLQKYDIKTARLYTPEDAENLDLEITTLKEQLERESSMDMDDEDKGQDVFFEDGYKVKGRVFGSIFLCRVIANLYARDNNMHEDAGEIGYGLASKGTGGGGIGSLLKNILGK